MKANKIPPQNYLKEILSYNKKSGILTWRDRPLSHFGSARYWKAWNKRFSGKTAGWVDTLANGKSYIRLKIDGKIYKAHRVIFVIMSGDIDESLEVDHINGNGTDNSWFNIRLVKKDCNAKNHRMQSNNTSGVVGVSWMKDRSKWMAHISSGKKKRITLGFFSDFDAAVKARKAAEVQYGYHKNHGTERPL